jgi:iron complex outermembrane recepter protein
MNSSKTLSAALLACRFGVLSAISQLAFGQAAELPSTSEQNAGATQLQEIVVTAEKREQRLNDVGLSVAVVGSEQVSQITAAGLDGVGALAQVVPGFSATSDEFGFPIFSLRGINTNVGGLSQQATVSTYIDGALLAYPAMTGSMLLDIGHVEVLKGPQGTLFGQNATGGAINVIPAQPTDHFVAGSEDSVNNFGGTTLSGYVSGPLTSTLRGRLSASTDQFGAWQECYYGCDQKNGAAHKVATRILLDWTPVDALKVSANLNASYDHGQPQALQLAYLNIQDPAHAYPGLANYPVAPPNDRAADFDQGLHEAKDNRLYQAVLREDLSLNDNMTLTAISDYAFFHQLQLNDDDGTALSMVDTTSFGDISSFSQEVRLAGAAAQESLHYIVGANYQDDEINEGNILNLKGYSGFPYGSTLGLQYATKRTTTGVFANADWEVIERLTLTGGVRYTWASDRLNGCLKDTGDGTAAGYFQSISNLFRGAEGLSPEAAFVPNGCITLNDIPDPVTHIASYLPYDANFTQRDTNVSWRSGINYKTSEDTLLYGLVSRGYKAGGYAPTVNIIASEFTKISQEELTSYEIGEKSEIFNRALVVNAALFYYQYDNKQFVGFEPSTVGDVQIVENIPKSKTKGVDIDLTAVPIGGLTIRGGVIYAKSSIGTFSDFNDLGNVVSVTGNPFNFAPLWTATIDSEYRMPVGSGLEAFIGGGGMYNSATYADLAQSPQLKINDFATINGRVGLASASGWHASLWVRNLADKYYWTNVTPFSDVIARVTGLPRTFGLTVGYKF